MVEWKKIKDVCKIVRGRALSKDDIGTGDYPVILYGELYTTYSEYITSIKSHVSSDLAKNAIPLKCNDLVLPVSSTTKEAQIGKVSVIKTETEVSLGSDAIILRDSPNADYLMYFINSQLFEKEKMKCVNGTTIMHLSPKKLGEKIVPIPSLSEQTRIVEILDTFTASIANLDAQIKARRKQYEYYIDKAFGGSYKEMISLGEKGDLELVSLSSHGAFTRGRRFVRTDVVEEGMPCIHYGDMYTYYGIMATEANTYLPYDFPKKMRYANKGDVIIVGAGENNEDIGVGVAWLGEEPAAVHDACYIYESDFDAIFLSYYLRSSIYHHQIKSNVVRGKICSISSEGIGKALIPLYPIEKQKEIVKLLLPFEASIANLEAQLKERKKQYEYYRNQLLTFE